MRTFLNPETSLGDRPALAIKIDRIPSISEVCKNNYKTALRQDKSLGVANVPRNLLPTTNSDSVSLLSTSHNPWWESAWGNVSRIVVMEKKVCVCVCMLKKEDKYCAHERKQQCYTVQPVLYCTRPV